MPSRKRYRFVQIRPKYRYTFEETLQKTLLVRSNTSEISMPSRNRYRFVQIHHKCRYTFEETLQSAFRTTLSRFAFQKEIYREKVTIAIPSGNLNFSTLPVSFLRKKSRFWFYSCQPRFTAVFLRNVFLRNSCQPRFTAVFLRNTR